MTRFAVFEPPAAKGSAKETTPLPSERAVFVRDGFSLPALLFPWVWLVRYGLLVSALAVFALSAALVALLRSGGAPLALPLLALLGVLVALEGPALRQRRFRRRGYRETGAVNARNGSEAAILYYAAGETTRGHEAGVARTALPWRFAPATVAESRKPRFAGWLRRRGAA